MPSAVEPLLQQRQHADELAEDQRAMAAVHHFLQQFAEQIQLAGGVGGIDAVQFEQPQIAADLPQPQQRAQHQHPALGRALRARRLQHSLAAGFDDLLINAALLRRQFAERHLFQLRRQIRRHFLLEPPQQEGPQPPRQPRLGGGVLFPRDGQLRSARGNPARVPR